MDATLIFGLLVGIVSLIYFFVLKQHDVAAPTYAPDTYSVVVKDKDGTCTPKLGTLERKILSSCLSLVVSLSPLRY